jgi:hypothetical protein
VRITINLDDDLLDLLKGYAEAQSVPLGQAASELVRRGLEAPVRTCMVNGFYAVVLPQGSARVTSGKVKQLLEDEI